MFEGSGGVGRPEGRAVGPDRLNENIQVLGRVANRVVCVFYDREGTLWHGAHGRTPTHARTPRESDESQGGVARVGPRPFWSVCLHWGRVCVCVCVHGFLYSHIYFRPAGEYRSLATRAVGRYRLLLSRAGRL